PLPVTTQSAGTEVVHDDQDDVGGPHTLTVLVSCVNAPDSCPAGPFRLIGPRAPFHSNSRCAPLPPLPNGRCAPPLSFHPNGQCPPSCPFRLNAGRCVPSRPSRPWGSPETSDRPVGPRRACDVRGPARWKPPKEQERPTPRGPTAHKKSPPGTRARPDGFQTRRLHSAGRKDRRRTRPGPGAPPPACEERRQQPECTRRRRILLPVGRAGT